MYNPNQFVTNYIVVTAVEHQMISKFIEISCLVITCFRFWRTILKIPWVIKRFWKKFSFVN